MGIPQSAESRTFAGRFTIERQIGRGASALVYLARDVVDNRDVAIKVLRPEFSSFVGPSRFLREIEITKSLHHAHIVEVLASGEQNGDLYFVLPFMEGGTLRERMNRDSQLPIPAAAEITREIATALDYAHRSNLIHRDVKPENILFSGGRACLADFGIARAYERASQDATTSTGIVRGTPAYMSPEQASGSRDYDGRSDVYSLACVFYEMVTGMPAFVGPSAGSVIAQRFTSGPRELRVYRASVPRRLEPVIQKAMAIAPADRYQSAGAFAQAIDDALADVGPDSDARSRLPRQLRRMLGAIAIIGIGAAGVFYASSRRDAVVGPFADTTRIAVLPFAHSELSAPIPQEELLYEALSRWRGVSVVDRFQVTDATRQRNWSTGSATGAPQLAAILGAGRYVRGELTRVGDTLRLVVAMYGGDDPRPLMSTSARFSATTPPSDSIYDRLTESLLVRDSGTAVLPIRSTHSVPARQAFAQALSALNQWDTERSDSLLQVALSFDANYAPAALWLAQVRVWAGKPSVDWQALAQRAIQAETDLSPREQLLATALVSLGAGRAGEACTTYERLRVANPRDFAAWYGAGKCIQEDSWVVRDQRSPTGWGFRTSYARGIDAYATAFKLLPSFYKSLERGAFQRLRSILYTDEDMLRSGVGLDGDTVRFLAKPVWQGDSIAFIPFRLAQVFAADSIVPKGSLVRAIDQQRRAFRDIAATWSAAFPRDAGAKEAVAVSLELVGDPSAVDTIRLARRLAPPRTHAVRLAATEILLTIKFSFPDNVTELRRARDLADSILGRADGWSDEEAAYLAPVAAMTFRCDAAVRLAKQGTTAENAFVKLPRYILGEASALAAASLLGCRHSPLAQAVARLVEQVDASDRNRQLVEQLLLAPTVRSSFPLDSVLVARLAGPDQRLLATELDLLRHQPEKTRAYLSSTQARRWSARQGGTPDAFYPEARLWLALGDSLSARRHLDSGFALFRRQPPTSFSNTGLAVARAASFALAARLRAGLAVDDTERKRWQSAVDAIQSTTVRMNRLPSNLSVKP